MATLVPVTVAIRVPLTRVFSAGVWTHGQASLERSCQSPQVHDETRFVEHLNGAGNHQHVSHAITSSRVESPSCIIEQTGGRRFVAVMTFIQLIYTVSRRS